MMQLLFRDRMRLTFLAAAALAAFVMVVGRRLGWAAPVRIGAMTVALAGVVGVLARWVRSAPDADDHTT